MNIVEIFRSELGRESSALIQVNRRTHDVRYKSELWTNVNNLCCALEERGVGEGHTVLILSGTTVQSIETILAVWNVGAIAVPVNPLLGANLLGEIVERTHPRCCISDDPLNPEFQARLGKYCTLFITTKSANRFGDEKHQTYSSLIDRPPTPFKVGSFEKYWPALIVFTSGSEGRPKAVRFTHENLSTFFSYHNFLYSQYTDEEAGGTTSAIVSTLPFNHLGGLAICLQGLLMDRPTYLLSHFSPAPYLKLIAQAKCTVTMLVPSMYASLLKERSIKKTNLSSLKFCISLGEALSESLAHRIEHAFGATVVSAYGLTECQTGIGFSAADLFDKRVPNGSCGTLLYGDVRLLDEQGREQESIGELWVNNPTVHRCYDNEALNDQKLRDGWFGTGDLFFRDEAGYFFHRGRADSMFVSNGTNIYPSELEEMLSRYPVVEGACAVAIKDKEGRSIPAVLVKASGDLASKDVVEFFLRNGPVHIVPRFVKIVEEMPWLGPQKVNRLAVSTLLQTEYDGLQA